MGYLSVVISANAETCSSGNKIHQLTVWWSCKLSLLPTCCSMLAIFLGIPRVISPFCVLSVMTKLKVFSLSFTAIKKLRKTFSGSSLQFPHKILHLVVNMQFLIVWTPAEVRDEKDLLGHLFLPSVVHTVDSHKAQSCPICTERELSFHIAGVLHWYWKEEKRPFSCKGCVRWSCSTLT